MEMAEELHEVVAARQGKFSMAWPDRDDAKPRGAGKAFGVDRRGELRRIELAQEILTGSDSMPRTKLE